MVVSTAREVWASGLLSCCFGFKGFEFERSSRGAMGGRGGGGGGGVGYSFRATLPPLKGCKFRIYVVNMGGFGFGVFGRS